MKHGEQDTPPEVFHSSPLKSYPSSIPTIDKWHFALHHKQSPDLIRTLDDIMDGIANKWPF